MVVLALAVVLAVVLASLRVEASATAAASQGTLRVSVLYLQAATAEDMVVTVSHMVRTVTPAVGWVTLLVNARLLGNSIAVSVALRNATIVDWKDTFQRSAHSNRVVLATNVVNPVILQPIAQVQPLRLPQQLSKGWRMEGRGRWQLFWLERVCRSDERRRPET